MKSAYELAMERLEKESPLEALSENQRAAIAETTAKFDAKIAEREVFLGDLIAKAKAQGSLHEAAELETQLSREVAKFRHQCEEAKIAIREPSEEQDAQD